MKRNVLSGFFFLFAIMFLSCDSKEPNSDVKSLNKSANIRICEDPSGLYFENNSFFNLKFYKYSKAGKYESYQVSTSRLTSAEGSVLSSGTFSIDNNELILTTNDKIIWRGFYDGVSLELKRITEVNNYWVPSTLTFTPRYGTAKEENLLPDEKTIDYEALFLYKLVQNYSEDEAAEEYAKVYHWEDYTKYKNDEFVWHDLFPKIKEEYLDKIKNLDNKFSMRFDWHFGDYDFENESFSIEFVEKRPYSQSYENLSVMERRIYNEVEDNESLRLALLEDKYSDLYVQVPLQLLSKGIAGIINTKSVKFDLPMPKAEAQQFLESRKDENGNYDRSVFVIVYYEVPKYKVNSLNTIYNVNTNIINGEFYKIVVYDSRENMKRLRSAELK